MVNIKKYKTLIFGVALYSFVSVLIVFYNHHYYDDEIFNLSKMLLSLGDVFSIVQAGDVHPPLSYVINKILFDVFLSYKAILVFSIIINAGALGYFYCFAEKKIKEKHSKTLLFIFVFLNGGILLWTNSVRWYAYWVPLFVILYTYLLKHQSLTSKNIFVIAILLSVMTYVNYLTFLLLVALSIFWVLLRRHDINKKNVFMFISIYFSLTFYQIFIFLTVHVPNKNAQVFGLLNSFLNAIYGVLNGGSVFIADPFFLIFSFLTLFVMFVAFKNIMAGKMRTNPLLAQSVVLFFLMLSLMILTGVSGKYRNNIALSIPFYFSLVLVFNYVNNKKLKKSYIALASLVSIISVYNLITHTNTSKNSFNMPVSTLAKLLVNPEDKLIITYDPATYFYLNEKGYDVYYLTSSLKAVNIKKNTNVYLIKTYQGSMRDTQFSKVLTLYESVFSNMIGSKIEKIGVDKYSDIKNILPSDIPKIDKVQMYVSHGRVKSNLDIKYNARK